LMFIFLWLLLKRLFFLLLHLDNIEYFFTIFRTNYLKYS
jgi:hypothetical protein